MSTKIISKMLTESELGQYLTDLVDATINAIKKLPDHDLQVRISCALDKAVDQPNAIQALFEVQELVTLHKLILFT